MSLRAPTLRLHADEIIVDSFAGGGGASLGIEWALGRSPDVAINHDPEAIAMHQANHPGTRHYCEDVWHVDPVVNGKPLSKGAQVRMVGNSVCPPLAAAVALAQFEDKTIEVAA